MHPSAKARVGFALGVFGEITRDDLLLIAEIRNAFAHSPLAITFNTPEIAEYVMRMRVLEVYRSKNVYATLAGDDVLVPFVLQESLLDDFRVSFIKSVMAMDICIFADALKRTNRLMQSPGFPQLQTPVATLP